MQTKFQIVASKPQIPPYVNFQCLALYFSYTLLNSPRPHICEKGDIAHDIEHEIYQLLECSKGELALYNLNSNYLLPNKIITQISTSWEYFHLLISSSVQAVLSVQPTVHRVL